MLLLLILLSYDVHARAEEAALAISFCSPSRWPSSPVSDVVDDDIESVRAIIVAPAAANLYLFAPRKVGRSV